MPSILTRRLTQVLPPDAGGGGNVTVTPGVVALSMSLLAAAPRVRALPSAVALVTSPLAATPRLRALPGAVALVIALPAATPRLRTFPGTVALAASLLAPTPRVRVHPVAQSNAAQFTYAQGDFLSHADDATLSGGAGSMTIAFDAWLDASPPADVMWLVSKWDFASAQREYGIRRDNATGLLDVRVTPDGINTTAITASSFGVLPTEQWISGLAWYDAGGGTLNIQIDNGAVDSVAYSSGIFNGTSRFQLSGIPFGQNWNGRQQHVRRWNRVLSAAERTEHFNGGLTLPYADLSAGLKSGALNAWDLDEPSDGTVAVTRRDALGADDLTDNGTVPSGVGKTVYHPIALGLSFPAPTLRIRVLPDAIPLVLTLPAPSIPAGPVTATPDVIALTLAALAATPRLRVLPSVVALTAALLAPQPRVRVLPSAIPLVLTVPAASIPGAGAVTATPGVIALTLAALAATPGVRVLTPAVALSMALLAPTPRVRVSPSVVALLASVLAATPRIGARPGTVALLVVVPGVGLRVVALPPTIAMVLGLPSPIISGGLVASRATLADVRIGGVALADVRLGGLVLLDVRLGGVAIADGPPED